jgi:hypothetical protein
MVSDRGKKNFKKCPSLNPILNELRTVHTNIFSIVHFNIILIFARVFRVVLSCKLFETTIRLFFSIPPTFLQPSNPNLYLHAAGRFSNKLFYIIPRNAIKTFILISERVWVIFLFKCNSD